MHRSRIDTTDFVASFLPFRASLPEIIARLGPGRLIYADKVPA
jgi:hypothetical protein